MSNIVKCGYIDNIIFDYEKNKLPIDSIFSFIDGLNWKETKDLIYWYNIAKKDGVKSPSHFKLCLIAVEIIRKYEKTAKWYNKGGYTNSALYHY